MNTSQTDIAVRLLIESATRAVRTGQPMSDRELLDRFDEDPVDSCIQTAVKTARRRIAERAEEEGT